MERFGLINLLFVIIFFTSSVLTGASDFKRVDQWKHDELCLHHFYSLIDPDNQVVGAFYKNPNLLISREKIVKFAGYGQSPNELTNLLGMFFYRGDLAMVEMPKKIKIFTKKNGTYAWKETKWLKMGKMPQIVKDGIFFDNKIFLAGLTFLESTKNENEINTSFIKVYDEKGTLLKDLVHKTFKGPNRFYLMKYYVIGYKTDRVFFLAENELKVTLISAKTLEPVKEVNLEIPSFYKKMPDDFYSWNKEKQQNENFNLVLENYAMGYSGINNSLVEGKYLVVQMRTCNPKLKKFALLFYNADSFKLEETIFIDDFLLGAKDGKYYFFANGDPSRDENTYECIINIYSFGKKSSK